MTNTLQLNSRKQSHLLPIGSCDKPSVYGIFFNMGQLGIRTAKYVNVTCKCGKIYKILESTFKSRGIGYCSKECKEIYNSLIGNIYGRLTVVSMNLERNQYGRRNWVCLCECGKTHIVSTDLLNRGGTKSCGCLRDEMKVKLNTRHGYLSGGVARPEYYTWVGLRQRCNNPNDSRYDDWGGRGIKVCDRWKSSFENFISDMGDRPSKNYSIERIDNNGDYCPENCRWATREEQNRNTRGNHYETYNGITMILEDWAREFGVANASIRNQLRKKTFEEVYLYYKNKTSGKWYEKRKLKFNK